MWPIEIRASSCLVSVLSAHVYCTMIPFGDFVRTDWRYKQEMQKYNGCGIAQPLSDVSQQALNDFLFRFAESRKIIDTFQARVYRSTYYGAIFITYYPLSFSEN